jgi:hypothetical protein
MDINPADKNPSRRGPAEWFTGTVWQDPVVEAPAPARLARAPPGILIRWARPFT